MRCYHEILHISYEDHVTNEEVHAKIKQAIRPIEDLLIIVKRHKLQWHCDVSHSSGLAKTILQGTVKGGRRQGRQRKRWEDNFREWTGLEFGKSQMAVENREKWRKLFAKSSVVPQRPSQLRNWWWWWWVWQTCTCSHECLWTKHRHVVIKIRSLPIASLTFSALLASEFKMRDCFLPSATLISDSFIPGTVKIESCTCTTSHIPWYHV